MPITASYEVRCDVCFGFMDGRYETREDAEAASAELGLDTALRLAKAAAPHVVVNGRTAADAWRRTRPDAPAGGAR